MRFFVLYTTICTHAYIHVYLSWSCKALNLLSAIHFNASTTIPLLVLMHELGHLSQQEFR